MKKFKPNFAFGILAFLIAVGLTAGANAQTPQYPKTAKVDHTDTYFGATVPDPYRWLEDDNSAETAKWVEEQNKVTFGYLEKIPYRATVKARLEKLYTLILHQNCSLKALSANDNKFEWAYLCAAKCRTLF